MVPGNSCECPMTLLILFSMRDSKYSVGSAVVIFWEQPRRALQDGCHLSPCTILYYKVMAQLSRAGFLLPWTEVRLTSLVLSTFTCWAIWLAQVILFLTEYLSPKSLILFPVFFHCHFPNDAFWYHLSLSDTVFLYSTLLCVYVWNHFLFILCRVSSP